MRSDAATTPWTATLLALALLSSPNAVAGQDPPPALTTDHVDHLEWRSIGPGGVGGRIVDFAVLEEDPRVMYVGTAYGGAWKSVNGGITWDPVFERENRAAVGGIAVAPANPNLVWIGTGEPNGRNLVSTSWGDGVYKSADGGATWTHMGLEGSEQIGRIRIHPENEDIVFVSVLGSLKQTDPDRNAARGLYRTTDGGATWDKILSAGEHAGIVDLDLDPRDPDLMYAAAWQRERVDWRWLPRGDESGLFRSRDGGDTWERLGNGLPDDDIGRIGVSVCRSQPDTVYAIFEGPEGGVFRSEDRGASWELRNSEVTGSQYYAQIRCDPNDPNRVYAPQTRLMVSHDGGTTFTNEMQGKRVHVDHHALWIDPANSDRLLLGNDGGVYLSEDRGDHWRFVANLPITQFYEIGVDLREPWYHVYGGTQDNNTWGGPIGTRNVAGIVNEDWYQTVGGDGFYAQIEPGDPRIVYTESQNGFLTRFDALTGERKRIKPADPEDCDDEDDEKPDCYRWNWSSPVFISQHDPATVYFGAQVLFRSRDRGDTWEVISPDLTKALTFEDQMNDYGTLRIIKESPHSSDLIVVGTDDGLVQITEDGGATWRRSEALPGVPDDALVRRVTISAHDPQTLYVASSGIQHNDYTPYLSRSTDLGRSWESIAAGLPDGSPLRAFAEHPRYPGVLFAGTEHGVLVSVDDGSSWVVLQNNLPTVSVHDMLVHPRDGDLLVGTHGRGIWVLDHTAVLGELAAALETPAAVFSIRPALQVIRFQRGRYSQADTYYWAPNPPDGAIIDLWLSDAALDAGEGHERPAVELAVLDAGGNRVRRLEPPDGAGVQRIVWDLRYDPAYEPSGDQGRPIPGPWVLPGTYTVELRVGDFVARQPVEVNADAASRATDAERRAWHGTQRRLARLIRLSRTAMVAAEALQATLTAGTEAIEEATVSDELRERVTALDGEVTELGERLGERNGRLARAYGSMRTAVGPPTADVVRLVERAAADLADDVAALNRLTTETVPELGVELDRAGVPWTPGRAIPLPQRRR